MQARSGYKNEPSCDSMGTIIVALLLTMAAWDPMIANNGGRCYSPYVREQCRTTAVVIVGIPLPPVSHDGVVRYSLHLSGKQWIIYIIVVM